MNRIILVTGSTSGIGKNIAKRFLEKENYVIVIGHDENNINKTKEELKEYANNVLFINVDITNEKEILKMFEKINSKYGRLDILINNAAFDKMSSIEEYDKQTFTKIIETNLIGKMLCIKNSIELLRKSEYPVIINISSRLSQRPMENSSAYCCAASAIDMLTKCTALELAKYNIRVNSVNPSLTLTPLAKQSYTNDEIIETAKKSLRHRLCEMDDIFNTIEFLTSKKSDFINGEIINISGGILLK